MNDRNKVLAIHEQRRQQELLAIVSTYEGRAVLHRILALTGLYSTSFAEEQTHVMAFREGKRDIGLRIMSMLQSAEPSAFAKMQQEAALRNAAEAQELEFHDDADE